MSTGTIHLMIFVMNGFTTEGIGNLQTYNFEMPKHLRCGKYEKITSQLLGQGILQSHTGEEMEQGSIDTDIFLDMEVMNGHRVLHLA